MHNLKKIKLCPLSSMHLILYIPNIRLTKPAWCVVSGNLIWKEISFIAVNKNWDFTETWVLHFGACLASWEGRAREICAYLIYELDLFGDFLLGGPCKNIYPKYYKSAKRSSNIRADWKWAVVLEDKLQDMQ